MTRREKKADARKKMFRQFDKEKVIGVDPIFFHKRQPNITRSIREVMSKDWQKISKEYDREHA